MKSYSRKEIYRHFKNIDEQIVLGKLFLSEYPEQNFSVQPILF